MFKRVVVKLKCVIVYCFTLLASSINPSSFSKFFKMVRLGSCRLFGNNSVDSKPTDDEDQTRGDNNEKSKTEKRYKGFPSASHQMYKNPDIYLEPAEIIRKTGHPCDIHKVNTEDGYILSLFRIPYGKNQNEKSEEIRPAVLFVHGILNSGAVWVLNSEKNVLAYQLAQRGFDCWILNARGTEYSNTHSEFETNSRKYWNFSWHQMAQYDIPLVIDYILQTSKNESLYYIGHSMGCVSLFAATSLKPELRKKIKLMIAFAPAVFLEKARTIFITVGARFPGTQTLISALNYGEFCLRSSIKMVNIFLPWIWNKEKVASWMGYHIMNLVNGSDREQVNWPYIPVIAGHMASPTSVKTYIHFLQLHKTGEFREFDYGRSKNLKEYGQPVPRSYDLSKSNFPVHIYYGENDACVQPEDAIKLASKLPNVISCEKVDWPKWSHTDFLWAIDSDTLINDHVVKILTSSKENS